MKKMPRPNRATVLRILADTMHRHKLHEGKACGRLLDALALDKNDAVLAVVHEKLWQRPDGGWTRSAKIGPLLRMLRREL